MIVCIWLWGASAAAQQAKPDLDIYASLRAHGAVYGGDVEILTIESETVRLLLTGACHDCPMAHSTLAEFVTERIRLYAPEVKEVLAV